MTPVTPIQQSPVEDLRNALMIADSWAQQGFTHVGVAGRGELVDAFASVARLLRHALDQLGEPNAAAIAVLREMLGSDDAYTDRYWRDWAAAVIHAQVSGGTVGGAQNV